MTSVEETTSTVRNLHLAIVKGQVENPLFKTGAGWIDVRDVALAHVLAAQKAEAVGQRIILSAEDCVVGDLSELAHTLEYLRFSLFCRRQSTYYRSITPSLSKRSLGREHV